MSRFIAEQSENVKKKVKELKIALSNDSPEGSVTHEYGFIRFDNDEVDENTRLSQYIHLALKTDPSTVVKFLRDAWHLPEPDLIISIAGGAKKCDLSVRLRKSFQIGLVSAAAATNAWIITAGTNVGVVKEVGQALNKYRYKNRKNGLDIPCIGIASWGYTAGKEQLQRASSVGSVAESDSVTIGASSKKNRFNHAIDAAQMFGDNVYNCRTYIVKQPPEKRCDLEPNHTHFLLLDDGTASADNVLALRADIEMHSRRIYLEQPVEGAAQTLIPVVMVLVEGGRASIQTMCEALDSNTPVVVVKGSGRAADLVVDIVMCFSRSSGDISLESDDFDESQHQRRSTFATAAARLNIINNIFARARAQNPWVDKIREELCRILNERRQFITVFDFDTDDHHGRLEDAILEAVFKAAKLTQEANGQHRSIAELRLALAWNNVEYARRVIFNDNSLLKWRTEDLRQILVNALRRNYADFIELFIEYGVSLETLTVGDLDCLYKTAEIETILPVDSSQTDVVTREEFYEEYMKSDLEIFCDNKVPLGETATRDLFIWACFIDRFKFATYLCSKTWDQSATLLFGAGIYRKAAEMTLDSEMKEEYEKNASTWDQCAALIIDQCFENDRDFAVNILRRPATAMYNTVPLNLAVKARSRAFLASKCVQKYLDNEWFGSINYKRQNIDLRIFLCTLFLPFLPILCGTLPFIRRNQVFNPNAIVPVKNRNFSNNHCHNITWREKFVFFYQAPIVRFYYNLIFFICFLGLFSYVLLVDFFPLNIYGGTRSGIPNLLLPITEIVLHVCVWGIIVEEIRQYYLLRSSDEYLEEVSNWLDLTAISLYLCAFLTRFIVNERFFTIAKIVLGLDLILWYVRILHFFAAYERLGPKLIMIFNTMKDLLFFVCFIVIFLFGFSISSWSFLITPTQIHWIYDQQGGLIDISISNDSSHIWGWRLIHDVANYGVWKVFGEVDPVETQNSYSAVAFLLTILFVTISNVLLLNVLVALFNVTVQNVRDQSHNLWRYQRFLLVNEFRNKSLLPPPFNIFSCLFTLIKIAVQRGRKCFRRHLPATDGRLTIHIVRSEENGADAPLKITDSMKREKAIAEDLWPNILKELEEKK